MRSYTPIALAAMTASLCLASYLLAGRAATREAVPTRFEQKVADAHNELAVGDKPKTLTGADKAVELSEKAVGNRAYTRAVAAEATARSYSSDDPKAGIHLQILVAMQNQKLIEQNERIIQLLEHQARQKSQ